MHCLDWLPPTVTPKSIAVSNLNMVRTAHHKHPWESCLVLVRLNIVLTLGYKSVPGSCDLAQGWRRYVHFKTVISLQHFFHFWFARCDLSQITWYLSLFGHANKDIHVCMMSELKNIHMLLDFQHYHHAIPLPYSQEYHSDYAWCWLLYLLHFLSYWYPPFHHIQTLL